MSDFIVIDEKEFKKEMKFWELTAPKKLVPAVVRGYVNDIAFLTKKTSQKTMDRVFDYKNTRSKRYLESAVVVQKAKSSRSIESIVAIVGVKAGSENQRKFYKREILTRQEEGGKLKQVKSRGAGFRSKLMVPAAGQNTKKTIRFRKAGLVRSKKSIADPRRAMAAAINTARDLKKRYASTPFGIYRVLSGRAIPVRVYKDENTISTPPSPWLKPASMIAVKKRERLFKKNLNRQLKKFKVK